MRRDADGKNGRLLVLSQGELIFRTFETETAERHAQRVVGFGKRVAAHGKRVGKRLTHPDFLRTLSWEKECNHCCDTVAAAISCSTR